MRESDAANRKATASTYHKERQPLRNNQACMKAVAAAEPLAKYEGIGTMIPQDRAWFGDTCRMSGTIGALPGKAWKVLVKMSASRDKCGGGAVVW